MVKDNIFDKKKYKILIFLDMYLKILFYKLKFLFYGFFSI